MNILITAGPTCEDIDAVRFITNRSTGMMGFSLANEAIRRGHSTTVITGPVYTEHLLDANVIKIRSAKEMQDACAKYFGQCDVFIASAAVADYTPEQPYTGKLKKSDNVLNLRLVRTTDILAEMSKRKTSQLLVGFALEVDHGRQNAEKKLREKRLDAVVLNSTDSFGSDSAVFSVLTRDGTWHDLGSVSKDSVARFLFDLIDRLAAASH